MRKKRPILFAILLIAIVGGLAWEVLRPREPMYDGLPLSYWLRGYDPTARTETSLQQADKAVRTLGTNAVPVLLRMARTADSPIKKDLIRLSRWKSWLPLHLHSDAEYHHLAASGFYALGPAGKEAVPALIELLKGTNQELQTVAADCLGDIGPASKAAVPLLVQMINPTNQSSGLGLIIDLGRIHREPELVVPILIQELNPPNATSSVVIGVLGQFGEGAKPAIPTLVPFLNSKDAWVRMQTTNALKQIDPEVAAKIFAKTYVGRE